MNAAVDTTSEMNQQEDQVSSDSDESDDEVKIYQDFVEQTRTQNFLNEDTDDEDFVFENGDDESDTDSQSSVATENLSDEDVDNHRSNKVSTLAYSMREKIAPKSKNFSKCNRMII